MGTFLLRGRPDIMFSAPKIWNWAQWGTSKHNSARILRAKAKRKHRKG